MHKSHRGYIALGLSSALLVVSACKPDRGRSPTAAEFDLPADGSTIDANAFHAVVKNNHGSARTYNRDGTHGTSACKKCVAVSIESVGLTTDIEPTTAVPKARVVAQIKNVDKDADSQAEMYQVKHDGKAEYYMWIDNGGSTTKLRYAIVELTRVPANRLQARWAQTGDLVKCHEDSIDKPSDADFQSCPGTEVSLGPKRSSLLGDGMLSSLLSRMFQDSTRIGEDPAWIRCHYGCCTPAAS